MIDKNIKIDLYKKLQKLDMIQCQVSKNHPKNYKIVRTQQLKIQG